MVKEVGVLDIFIRDVFEAYSIPNLSLLSLEVLWLDLTTVNVKLAGNVFSSYHSEGVNITVRKLSTAIFTEELARYLGGCTQGIRNAG
jgi:hypothetical protein